MRIDRPPYWFWQLDRWNILVAVALLGATVIAAVTGGAPASITPTITQPAAGAALNYAAPGALAGRAAPGARVRIYDGDILLGETTADQAGYYRFSLPTLGPGPHTLTTRVYDAKGNLIASSEPVTINIVGAPATPTPAPTPTTPKPTVQPPAFTGLTEGAQLSAGSTLTGTAAPGVIVRLFANDKQIGEAVTGADGKWSLPFPALSAGGYTLVARAFAPDGTQLAESAPIKVTVPAPTPTVTPRPTVAPPAFAGLSEGGQWPAGKPTELAGTAAPGTKIQVFDGDKLLGETTAGPDGKWRLALPALTEGAHNLTARAVAPDGTVLASSQPIKVNAITVAPPAFTGLSDGGQLPAGKVNELSGTAAPGTKIQVFDGDKLLGETTAGPDGNWRLILPALSEGAHTLTARAVSPDGVILAASPPIKVAAVTVAPPTFAGLPEGSQWPAGKPTELAGTAAPGTKIQVFDGDKLLAETTTGPDGKWRLALPALTEGAHSLTARAVSPDGVVLATSAPIKVNAVTVAPPAFTGLPEGGQLPAGKVNELSGTAAPGAKIQIFDGNKLLGETTAGPDGQWRLILPDLAEGTHTLTARVVSPDGIVLATSAPATVIVASATATPAPTATTTPTASPMPTATLEPGAETASVIEGAPITLSGTAGPGAKLRIYDGETQIGEAVADTDGQWRLTLPPLAVGQHKLTARVYDADGRLVSSSSPLYLTVTSKAAPGAGTPGAGVTPAAPGQTPATPIVLPEITNLKPGAQLPATSPGLLEGTARPGATVRIYDGDKLIAEVVAGKDGVWRILLPALGEGPHALAVREVLPDGTEQLGAVALPVTIVPSPAATPVAPAPGVAAAATPMISRPAGALGSSQPVLSGTAAPRSTVRIYDGDYLLGETQADARGRWVFVPPIALAVGKHTLRVTSVGPDGRETPGGVIELTVAEGATGLKPLTFMPSTGKAPSPVGILQGSAPPDTLVSIYEGTTLLAKVLADTKGLWQYSLPARTRSGPHTYIILVATRDGATLYRSEPATVTIN